MPPQALPLHVQPTYMATSQLRGHSCPMPELATPHSSLVKLPKAVILDQAIYLWPLVQLLSPMPSLALSILQMPKERNRMPVKLYDRSTVSLVIFKHLLTSSSSSYTYTSRQKRLQSKLKISNRWFRPRSSSTFIHIPWHLPLL